MTTQRIGKYACLELERKYLLSTIPDSLRHTSDGWLITDRYLPDTRLRLRHMRSIAGNESIFKLTQKYRARGQAAIESTITNLYLTEGEHSILANPDARIVEKVRHPYSEAGCSFSIDVFQGRHRGLILAEVELESASAIDEVSDKPSFALRDVTEEPFFLGGRLAMLSEAEFSRGLSRFL